MPAPEGYAQAAMAVDQSNPTYCSTLLVPVRVSSRAAKSTPMSLRPGENVVPGATFIRPLGPSMVDSATHVQEPSGLRLKPLCIAVIYRPLLLLALTWARQ